MARPSSDSAQAGSLSAQLGSVCRNFESASVAKKLIIELVGYFFFLLSSFRSNKVNLFKTNLNLMCHIVKKGVITYIKL